MDRRAARTRRALHEALISLILRKGYDDITVQDIIDEADVGRSTFYAHYSGKEDLLRGGFERLRADLAELRSSSSRSSEGACGEPFAFSLVLFQHAEGYKDVYRALAGGSGGAVAIGQIRDVLAEFVREELPSRQDAAIPRELEREFVLSAFLSVLTWWLKRTPELAPSDVEALFRQLLFGGVGGSHWARDG
jgi:AcrR family transcriptional regulator